MGGRGSGLYYHWQQQGSGRDTIEERPCLDVRTLRRAGMLRPGAGTLWSWNRSGTPAGSVGLGCVGADDGRADGLRLSYTTHGAEERDVLEVVPIVWTPCHYGGSRPWFVCPSCRRRRAVLALGDGRFRCRECQHLAYASTREDASERASKRCRAIRKRLGDAEPWKGSPYDWRPPWKPSGMHWRTYHHLLDAYEGETIAFYDAFLAGLATLTGLFDRAQARSEDAQNTAKPRKTR